MCALSMCVWRERVSEREREMMRAVKKKVDQSASLKKLPAQHDWFGPWVFLASGTNHSACVELSDENIIFVLGI